MLRLVLERHNGVPPEANDHEHGPSANVDRSHREHHVYEAEVRNQIEASCQRSDEGPRRIEGIHKRMKAGGILEAPCQPLSQDGDGATHQDGCRTDQHRG